MYPTKNQDKNVLDEESSLFESLDLSTPHHQLHTKNQDIVDKSYSLLDKNIQNLIRTLKRQKPSIEIQDQTEYVFDMVSKEINSLRLRCQSFESESQQLTLNLKKSKINYQKVSSALKVVKQECSSYDKELTSIQNTLQEFGWMDNSVSISDSIIQVCQHLHFINQRGQQRGLNAHTFGSLQHDHLQSSFSTTKGYQQKQTQGLGQVQIEQREFSSPNFALSFEAQKTVKFDKFDANLSFSNNDVTVTNEDIPISKPDFGEDQQVFSRILTRDLEEGGRQTNQGSEDSIRELITPSDSKIGKERPKIHGQVKEDVGIWMDEVTIEAVESGDSFSIPIGDSYSDDDNSMRFSSKY